MLKEKLHDFICSLPVLRGIFKRLKKIERKTENNSEELKKLITFAASLNVGLDELRDQSTALEDRIAGIEEENKVLLNRIELLFQKTQLHDEQNKIFVEQNEKLGEETVSLKNEILKIKAQVESKYDNKVQDLNNRINWMIGEFNRRLHYYFFRALDPKEYSDALTEWYNTRMKAYMNLDNPVTFNEKIQWLKLYDNTPLKTELADKYRVRFWVTEKIGDQYLIPMLGLYDNFEKIDFNELPDQFVMKCTHGSGWNIVVSDKESFDYEYAKDKFNYWLNKNYGFILGLELQYKDIKPRIIIEKYQPCRYEYQFWCFNGMPSFVSVISKPHGENKKATYDMEWNRLEFVTSLPRLDVELEKPVKFEEMVYLARKLSTEFALVRVDFFYDEGQIFFNELTFTPASGTVKWDPPEYDEYVGKMLDLPKKN